jgi:hypothetical protein
MSQTSDSRFRERCYGIISIIRNKRLSEGVYIPNSRMKPRFVLITLLAIFSACENHDINPVAEPQQLESVTSYFEHETDNFEPASKTVFAYKNNKLSQKLYYTYDIIENDFALFSTSNFTFSGDGLVKIVETIGTSLTKTTTFEYAAGQLTAIHIDDEIDTEIAITYMENNVMEAVYSFSNGRSFKYRISSSGQNIVTEQTFDDGGSLASEVTNEFDTGINPYNRLGYYDPFFSNFSKNNKVTTESEYYSLAFPQLVPVAYEYIYNEKNLPTQQIITYKPYPNGANSRHLKNVFEYKN